MQLIVISSPHNVNNEHQILNDLFKAGLKTFHLRKPTFPLFVLEDYIQQIPEKYHNRIVIHTNYDLMLKYNLKGIHITRKHKKNPFRTWLKTTWLKYKKPNMHISTSIHSLQEVLSSTNKYNYLFLSPIFKSISKSNYQPKFDFEELQTTLNNSTSSIIALGGIDASKIDQCKDLGFKGVALLGGIWHAPDPLLAFKECKTIQAGVLATS